MPYAECGGGCSTPSTATATAPEDVEYDGHDVKYDDDASSPHVINMGNHNNSQIIARKLLPVKQQIDQGRSTTCMPNGRANASSRNKFIRGCLSCLGNRGNDFISGLTPIPALIAHNHIWTSFSASWLSSSCI